MKKRKILKAVRNALIIVLCAAVFVAGFLFFPLPGKKHVEIWSRDKEFDISKIQTVEKNATNLKF